MLGQFIRALREADIEVSPAEAIDAYKVAAVFGYGDRRLLHDYLSMLLAKTETEAERFDACFDRFFARTMTPPPPRAASQNPAFLDESDSMDLPDLVKLLLAHDEAGLSQLIEKSAREAGTSSIAVATQRGTFAHRVMIGMGIQEVDALIAKGEDSGDPHAKALAQRLTTARTYLLGMAQARVERDFDLYAAEKATRQLQNRLARISLAAIKPAEVGAVQALCRRMAQRLVKKQRSQRSLAHRGKLDVRRTIRHSLATSGIPFRIEWKRHIVKRQRLVVVCDVSKSVAPYAGLLLLFLHTLHDVFDHVDSFAFSDRLFPIGDLLEKPEAETVIIDVIRRCGLGATDYGRSIRELAIEHKRHISRRTVVLFLGDARTNHGDPALAEFQQIKRACRGVVWLNPEPARDWGTGDSAMEDYRIHCDLVRPCGNLEQLDRAMVDMMRQFPVK
ncbi:VWA domain-containing protein [Sphingopyxis granuli]|uniref:VWA domain-containing protein n=1 Tax=Sphingopyxis granuli TaxID=267128 RepID=UPI001F537375|nr:VWA domain-containing protein [Sphingopyxis granuli]UNK81318.1 VWA domain-containing protein [Sphingopyxis granuli]